MTKRRHRLTGLAAIAAAAMALIVAACGGSSEPGPDVAELDTTPTETTELAPEESRAAEDIIVDFTQCLRDEGFAVPDPDFNASAAETQRGLAEAGIDVNDPEFTTAIETCEPRLAGILSAIPIEDLQALSEATIEYARCMRENGIDLPDPDFTQGFFSTFGDDIDIADPDFEAADLVCSVVFDDAPQVFGDGS